MMLRLAAVLTVSVAVFVAGAEGATSPVRIGVVCVGASGSAHGGTVKPSSIMIACADANYWIDHLAWKGWGTAAATSAGKVHYNDCTPYCAAGHFHVIPGTATLSSLKAGTCKGAAARFYTRLRVVPGRRGKNIPAAVDESLPAHC
ncbi:MAG: hypothetical protein ACXVRQ_08480 [Gaiellaceae bacterium]